MRKFNVNVNGNMYVVEVEETTEGAVAAPIQAAPVAPAAPATAKPVVAGGTALKSPMPGKILKLLCKDGDNVAKNQKVAVLEAMKMENDIVAPIDGTISFTVKEGDDVNSQQDIAFIK